MAEPIVLGIVGIKNMGEYDSETQYEKLNVVTYQGSTYCALKDTLGNLPTNTEYWQLYAEKGGVGPQGPKPVKGTDYFTEEDITSIENDLKPTITSDVSDEVTSQLGSLVSATPLGASSMSDMTDTTRIYVLETDGHWYWYNGTGWRDGGVYQATGIADNSVTIEKLGNDVKYNLNSRTINVNDLIDNNEQSIDLSSILINSSMSNGNPNYDSSPIRVVTEFMLYIPKDTNIIFEKPLDEYIISLYRYDKDFNYLSTKGMVMAYNYEYILTCNNNASYIRIDFRKIGNENITIAEVLENIKVKFQKINIPSSFEVGTNKFNKNDFYEGYIRNDHYSIESHSNYRTTKIMKLKPLTTYSISSFRKLVLYDENLEYITDSFIDENTDNYTFTTTGTTYMIMSYLKNKADTTIINEGSTVLPYEPYRLYLPDLVYIGENHDDNILYGKKLTVCGDSFSAYTNAQFDSGIYEGRDRVWSYLIGLRNNMVINNMAVSGSTMSRSSFSGTNFCDTLYTQIPNDSNYILIKYGINDNHGNVPIGTIDSSDDSTFYGAWNKVMSYIITNHPLAKIGIIVTNGLDLDTSAPNNSYYANVIIEIAKKYGIPTLNEWNDPNVPLLLRTGRTDVDSSIRNIRKDTFKVSDSNTHENYLCQEYESTFIEDFLRSL